MYLPFQGRVELTGTLTLATVFLAAIILAIWAFFAWKKRGSDDRYNSVILTGLASVALVPFILPRMHQRYFYPQDIFSLLAAFFMPELWFLPILSQVISVLAYSPFLFNVNLQINLFGSHLNAILYVALPLEIIAVVVILWKQFAKSTFGKSEQAGLIAKEKELEISHP